jgi:NADPH:quinone reductase-like Zn-dependent oxidoreductase
MSIAVKPTYKRNRLPEKGKPIIVEEVPTPELKEGQVLIQVHAAPICPADFLWTLGIYPTNTDIPGLESAGIVIKSGGGAKADALVGKPVATLNPNGNWAEYTVAEVQNVFEISPDSNIKIAACSFINPLTVLGMLTHVKNGNHKAVVHTAGASSIGKILIQSLEKEGLKSINIVRKQDQVEKLSKDFPYAVFLNSTAPDFQEQLTKHATELNATIAFEAVGGPLLGQVLAALPPKSALYFYGNLTGQPGSGINSGDIIFKRKTIQGYMVGDFLADPAFMAEVPKIVYNLPANLQSEIQKEFSLAQANEAIQFMLANGSGGRVIINPAL